MRVSTLLGLGLVLMGCRPITAEITTPTPSDSQVEQPAPGRVEPVERPADAASQEPVASIAEFGTFMGLRWGDSRADMLARLGDPAFSTAQPDSETYCYYLLRDANPDDGPPNDLDQYLLEIAVDSRSGWVSDVLVRNFGDSSLDFPVSDPRLDLIGVPFTRILAVFGPPIREMSGHRTYEQLDEGGRGVLWDVEFLCFVDEEELCVGIRVAWYEPVAERP